MRSSRTGSKWDRSIDESGAYSSSEEDDERARLKKPHGSSGGGGGCGVYGRSSEVTSPIESDNTYAEANLLQTDKGMDLSDSEVYEGSNGSINRRYQPPHQNILRSPHREPHRFLGGRSNSSQDNKSQFYGTGSRGVVSSRTSTNLPIRRATNGPLPDPPNTSTRRGGQLVITPDRNWGNGEPLGMAETRLGNREDYGLKYGTSLHLAHQSQPKGSRNQTQQQSLVSLRVGEAAVQTTKASSLHRRSLSDDSLSIDKHINPNSSGGSTSTAVITSASNPVSLCEHSRVIPRHLIRPQEKSFELGKKCSFHCSWKLVAFALTLLTLVLSSVIAYFGAVKYPSHSPLRDVIISEDCITSDPPLSVLSVEKQQMQQADSNILNYPSRSRPVTITISPGRPYEALIDPMTFWRSRLPSRFPPSVTNYDWIHIVSNGELRIPDIYSLRSKRSPSSSGSSRIISISESFPLGDMFLAVLNDGLSPVGIRISLFEDTSGSSSIMLGSESTSRKTSEESSISLCLNDCSGQGKCVNGNCVCNPRFSGPDCTLSVCPLLCSGNGIYRGGVCVCADGWKGLECDVLVNECKDPDCNGHGLCSPKGICICEPGWSGDSCEERDCEAKDCNGHGICRNAICHCHPGWMGNNCEKSNDALLQCLPNCSGHGIYDYTAGLCDCQESWTGSDCNITLCSLDCGRRGLCLHGSCSCEEGWTGPRCAYRICDERCASHGQCKDGKCLCQRGWNGKHCSLNGCGPEGKCNDRGNCDVNMNGEYECKCYPGWTGRYCEYHDETDCEDGIDNDENGLTDCADSRCCSHPSCRKNIMCVYSADPVEVLSGKDHGSYLYESGSSFFERVQFLFEGQKSVQSYAKNDAFDPMRASIIRGRVITSQGQGIIGVRVSVDRVKEASNYGFTLTRPEGWFDMVVNGGGAVTLQFQRSPLKAMTRTTYIPWNRIVVINPVVMTSYGGMGISRDEEDTSLQVSYFEPCQAHDYEKVKPKVFSSYFSQYTAPTSGHLSPEIQAFREKIQVPHTNLNLVYSSSSAPGYKSLIHVCLTPSLIAESLDNITLKITVAGTVFRKTFEADPNLNYKFAWNKKKFV
ncbi:Teneurin-m,Tenascin,Teneurin-a [Lepeophtheirus salmonis]|uniref:Teneurin-m,Tenascin,Teneurin-a n=1 Tax=Lepeophtheirus salmonis TaxID=72036 RepID=A0A7R8CT51_LEPSM|nr:Teneurin-m,Tenascin,Teneurin-a [Lepeophtheirus salmonis]CAF2923263.1 Teneurin-m,Tenascin,Teneurin-a [Lepeophtheirus salmonis]